MNKIEKNISNLIGYQFPSFYKEEGPEFIAFVKAYYEWLEATDRYRLYFNTLIPLSFNLSRKIININDPTYTPIIIEVSRNYIEVLGENNFSETNELYQIVSEKEYTTTVSVVSDSNSVVGISTTFLNDFNVGDYILVNNQLRKIVLIQDNLNLFVDKNWNTTSTNFSYKKNVLLISQS